MWVFNEEAIQKIKTISGYNWCHGMYGCYIDFKTKKILNVTKVAC